MEEKHYSHIELFQIIESSSLNDHPVLLDMIRYWILLAPALVFSFIYLQHIINFPLWFGLIYAWLRKTYYSDYTWKLQLYYEHSCFDLNCIYGGWGPLSGPMILMTVLNFTYIYFQDFDEVKHHILENNTEVNSEESQQHNSYGIT